MAHCCLAMAQTTACSLSPSSQRRQIVTSRRPRPTEAYSGCAVRNTSPVVLLSFIHASLTSGAVHPTIPKRAAAAVLLAEEGG